MNKKIIKFEIVTPERVVLQANITQVTIPTKDGEITVLANHIPLVSILKPGVMELLLEDGEREVLSVSGGFIEVLRDKVVVLADTAERAHELDFEKVEEARARAEKIKSDTERSDEQEFSDISSRLAIELARTKAVIRWRKLKNLK